MKGILRFLLHLGLITLLGFLVTPHIKRGIEQLAERVPHDSVLEEILIQLRDNLGRSLVTAIGESVTDLVVR
jgi:hypothetical protein